MAWSVICICFLGALNGFYQVAGEILNPVREFLIKRFHICREAFSHCFVRVVSTFIMVDFAWLFFRAGSMDKAKEVLKSMFYFNPEILIDGSLYKLGIGEHEFVFLFYALIVLMFVDYLKYRKIDLVDKFEQQGIWFRSMMFAMLFWVVLLFGKFGPAYEASQFIYFQF